jgi:hypothetical protein
MLAGEEEKKVVEDKFGLLLDYGFEDHCDDSFEMQIFEQTLTEGTNERT